jgi:hypothetical protein
MDRDDYYYSSIISTNLYSQHVKDSNDGIEIKEVDIIDDDYEDKLYIYISKHIIASVQGP